MIKMMNYFLTCTQKSPSVSVESLSLITKCSEKKKSFSPLFALEFTCFKSCLPKWKLIGTFFFFFFSKGRKLCGASRRQQRWTQHQQAPTKSTNIESWPDFSGSSGWNFGSSVPGGQFGHLRSHVETTKTSLDCWHVSRAEGLPNASTWRFLTGTQWIEAGWSRNLRLRNWCHGKTHFHHS